MAESLGSLRPLCSLRYGKLTSSIRKSLIMFFHAVFMTLYGRPVSKTTTENVELWKTEDRFGTRSN